MTEYARYSFKNIIATGNTLSLREMTTYDNQRAAGIVTADIVEIWFKLAYTGKDRTDLIGGNRIRSVTVDEDAAASTLHFFPAASAREAAATGKVFFLDADCMPRNAAIAFTP